MRKTTEVYYLKREIKTHGDWYIFERNILDEYGEETKQKEKITEIKGILHIEKAYIKHSALSGEGSTIREKGQPKLLVMYDDSIVLHINDFVTINGERFVIRDKNNVNMYGIVCDLSLEVVLDGTN